MAKEKQAVGFFRLLLRRIRIPLHNIKILCNCRLEDLQWDTILKTRDTIAYGNLASDNIKTSLNILDSKETLDCLLKETRSFYRFGDAEINIMLNQVPDSNTCSQKYDPILAQKLFEALTTERDDVYIGVGYRYFDYDIWDNDLYSNKFFTMKGKKFRDFYEKYCDSQRTYLSTEFNQQYFKLNDLEKDEWFKKTKLLFKDKKMTLFMGKETFDNLDYYVFEDAIEVNYEFCPSRDSFDKYDELLLRARKRPVEDMLCFAIGPTSKVLAYELSKEGRLCLDIGHLPKDYDYYKKRIVISEENNEQFYKGDYIK